MKKSKIFILMALTLILNGCQPVLGNSWYRNSSSETKQSMYITAITVAGQEVIPMLAETPVNETDAIKKFSTSKIYIVVVPPDVEDISQENITIKAVNSLATMQEIQVTTNINGGGTALVPDKQVPITIHIQDNNGKYEKQEKIIKITQRAPYDLELKNLKICECEVDLTSNSVTIPYKEASIDSSKIKATFKYGETETVIPVKIEGNSISLNEEETVDIKFFVESKKNQYKYFEKTVAVTREKKSEDEDEALQLEKIYVCGIEAEIGKPPSVPKNTLQITDKDIILSFKKFGYIHAYIEPHPATFDGSDVLSLELSVQEKQGKYQSWKKNITVIKSDKVLYNPVDKNGNKKNIVDIKTITENVSPFTYYDENHEFPASRFDDWVVYINSFNNGTNVASYKFKKETWQGTPDTYNGPNFGSGFKVSTNVKFYRYKTRKDRWANHGGYIPPEDTNYERFYFYRFTSDSGPGGIVHLDNSMFCVDRHSKFLFYYSDPENISGQGVPSSWKDYSQPDAGSHKKFEKPFYMSDPVGYVKKDGSVILYEWIKNNISNNNYTAQENTVHSKAATKSPNGAGYSPYRNDIEIKKTEVSIIENPQYTVSEPSIVGQPKPVYAKIGDNVCFEVKVLPAPQDEEISYQWYKKLNEAGAEYEKIIGETQSLYTLTPTEEINAYCYCEITVTNTKNSKTTKVNSEQAKLFIASTEGGIIIDAETPVISKQPENKSLPIGSSEEITLTIEASSPDNGVISYKWYKADTETSPGEELNIVTDSYTFTPDTSSEKDEFYYCVVTNYKESVNGNKTATRTSNRAKISVEPLYKVNFGVAGNGGGNIVALHKGRSINSGDYIKKGDKIRFIATPKDEQHYIKNWAGFDSAESHHGDEKEITVQDGELSIFVSFEKRITLKITPKIYNESLKSWSTADGDHFNHKYTNGVHLAHKILMQVEDGVASTEIGWTKTIKVENNGGQWLRVTDGDFIKTSKYKESSEHTLSKEFTSFPQIKINLYNHLIKANRHDSWWAEWTTLGGGNVYPLQAIDNNSKFTLIYNENNGEWTVDNVDLKNANGVAEPLPLPPEYKGTKPNPNRKIAFKGVTISYDENFNLKVGEEKDFVITYTVNNPATKSEGTIKITYTISWK